MAIRDIFKVSRKTFFNPVAWLGYDTVKEGTLTIWTVLKSLFTRTKPGRKETYEEALKRLNIKEEEASEIGTIYRLYAWIFAIFGGLIFYYSFYILFKRWVWTGWSLGVAAACLCFAQAFKYDFWSLQIRRKKLGLSFDDWLRSLVGGKEKSK